MSRPELVDVRDAARGRWPEILARLGLDRRALSGKHGPCPACGGRDRFRFDDKDGRGTYYCGGCGAGDGVQLAMAVTGKTFKEVAAEVKVLAGVVEPTARRPEQSDDDKRRLLRKTWAESRPLARGDVVTSYLAGRGLALLDLPEGLRLHPAMLYRDETRTQTFPAMIAIVTGPDGSPRSLHRTYLHPDGGKAPVAAPKKLMPGLPIAGGAIRLTPVSECLGVAEGIETALAAAEQFQMPVWSCISAKGVESFEPPAGVRELVIFADNDENFAGQRAAYACAHRLALKGVDVEVQIPREPGDWADLLMGVAA